jgi:hypothetical protein
MRARMISHEGWISMSIPPMRATLNDRPNMALRYTAAARTVTPRMYARIAELLRFALSGQRIGSIVDRPPHAAARGN